MHLSISRGNVQQVYEPAKEGKFCAFRARVWLDTGKPVTAYVKLLDPQAIASEVVCAVLGRLAGLPIPAPLIVRYGTRLGFGSLAMDPSMSLARTTTATHPRLVDAFKRWKKAFPTACFDEWVANSDRHGGNILVAGADEFYLIDHNLALPSQLSVSALADRNQLFERIAAGCVNESDRVAARTSAAGAAADLSRMAVPTELQELLADLGEVSAYVRRGYLFIVTRMAHLVDLCEHRTPVAQLSLREP